METGMLNAARNRVTSHPIPYATAPFGNDAAPGRRVLIIEDDRDIVRGMKVRLRTRGFNTMEAYDGQEGLEVANEEHPDAILLDVRMPRMDGLTTLHNLHSAESTRKIPVIMLSASLADQEAALDAGARFFLKKPYQDDMLLSALETAIHEAADMQKDSPEHAPENARDTYDSDCG
jgi:CheY-like chemotaxis protein